MKYGGKRIAAIGRMSGMIGLNPVPWVDESIVVMNIRLSVRLLFCCQCILLLFGWLDIYFVEIKFVIGVSDLSELTRSHG